MVDVPAGESVKLIDASNPSREFQFSLTGNGVRIARHKLTATDTQAKEIIPGDRGRLQLERGESLYAFGTDSKGTGRIARFDLDKAGFFINFQPRTVQATVETTAEDREAPPSSDDFIFESGSNVTVSGGGTITEDFEAPDRADNLGILVEADAAADVNVRFKPQASANVIASRGPTQDPTYATVGGPSNQVFKSTLIVAPHIVVDITDTSGATNTVSYALYAR